MSRRDGARQSTSSFQDDESFLAMAQRTKSEIKDLTFRTSPGSPVASSTVARPTAKNADQNERLLQDVDMRGSLYGVQDIREQEKRTKPGKQDHLKLSPIHTPSPSSEIKDPCTVKKKPFYLELLSNDSSDIQEFIKTHNVSEMLEKVDFSTSHLSTNGANTKEHPHPPKSTNSKTSVSSGSLSLQEWTNLHGDPIRPTEARESLVSLGTEISEVSSLGILNMDEMDMSSSLIHVDSGLLKELKSPTDNDKEIDSTLRDVSDIDDHFADGEPYDDDPVRVRKAMESLMLNGTGDDGAQLVQRIHDQNDAGVKAANRRSRGESFQRGSVDEGFHREQESRLLNSVAPFQDRFATSRDYDGSSKNSRNTHRQSYSSSIKGGSPKANSTSKMLQRESGERQRDFVETEKITGVRKRVEDGDDRFDGYDASDEEAANGEDERRGAPSRRHVTGGYRQQRSLDSGPSSQHSSVDKLDSMFFNHSDQATSQRPGSGDGGEGYAPTPTPRSPVPPSPSRLGWMGSQDGAFPLGEESRTTPDIELRISGVSIQFDDDDSTDTERDRYFRSEVRGKATGLESVDISEIDTEDELAAVRKENTKQAGYFRPPVERLCIGDSGESSEGRLSRPGLEGGSSDENDNVAFPPNRKAVSMRQSAEGEVVVPVPGDGGGGGDGMSDRETGSTVPSAVVSGHSSFDMQQGFGMAFSVQGVTVDEGRDVEGQSRSQPIGDGIVDSGAPPRQVRFASVDHIWQRQLSGSDFGSDFSRDVHSSDQSSLNENTNTPTMEVSPNINQFLLPSNHSQGANSTPSASANNWMTNNASSIHFSQISGFQDEIGDFSRNEGAVDGSNESFERTLTPRGMQAAMSESATSKFGRVPSFGVFGDDADNQFPNDHDFTFSQKLSFGEGEFSEMYRGSFSSDHSSDRLSSDREGPGMFGGNVGLRESIEGAPQLTDGPGATAHRESQTRQLFTQLGFAEPEQHTGPVYFDEHGEGVTDLAFRTSLPFIHQQGALNPFDTSGHQQVLANDMKDEMGGVDFGIASDEEFAAGDVGMAMLEKDEKVFEKEHVINQDDNMSVPTDSQYSNWSLQNTTHMNITGDEPFCRISMGAFISRRTETLGSLSGEGIKRPSFGDGEIISPPSATPVAIFNASENDSPPSNSAPATSERYSGVGQYTVETHQPGSQIGDSQPSRTASLSHQRKQRPRISGRENDFAAKATVKTNQVNESLQQEWQQLPEGGISSDNVFPDSNYLRDATMEHKDMCGDPKPPHLRIAELVTDAEQSKSGSGRKTPPLNVSTIATAIAAASSTTNADDLAAMIMAYSNKQRETYKSKSNGQEEKGLHSDAGGSYRDNKEDKDLFRIPANKVIVDNTVQGMHSLQDLDNPKKSERERKDDVKTDARSGIKTSQRQSSSIDNIQNTKSFPTQPDFFNNDDALHDLSIIPSKPLEDRAKARQYTKSSGHINSNEIIDQKSQLGNSARHSKPRHRVYRQEGRVVNGDGMEKPELCRTRNSRISAEKPGNNEIRKQKQKQSYNDDSGPTRFEIKLSSKCSTRDSQNSHSSHISSKSVANGEQESCGHEPRGGRLGEPHGQRHDRQQPKDFGLKRSPRTLPSLPNKGSFSNDRNQDLDECASTKYARQVEAIMKAVKEAKDMMSSSSESDESIMSPTPSPEDTPKSKRKFSFDITGVEDSLATEEDVIRETQKNGVDEEQVSPVVSAQTSGRRTSTPSEKKDICDDLKRNNRDIVGNENEGAQLHRHEIQPVSSFQAFPNGPHFSINPHTSVPTLLTSQSLMGSSQVSQYLNDRPITHSRPASSLNTHRLSPHLGNLVPGQLAASHDPQSLYGNLAGSGIATSTAPYYTHVGVQPPGHYGLQTAPIHLYSTYPSSGVEFPQSSLPSFQGLPPGPGLGNTGVMSQLQAAPGSIASAIVVPSQLRFRDVCCLGIATQSVLPLHNPNTRWLQCTLDIVSVTANGEEITNIPPVFIIKIRTIVSPHTIDEIKILFAPHQPGVYTAQVQVGSSAVVADTEARLMQHTAPQMVVLTAMAERPNIEFDIDSPGAKLLDFGEMGTGLTRSKRIHLVNKGRSTVPVRLLLTSTSSAWHYFSLSVEAKKSQTTGVQHPATHSGTSAASRPLHVTLEGKQEGDNHPQTTVVWVHFKAPPDQIRGGSSGTLGPPDAYFAKLEVELDVPGRQAMALAEQDLKAVVGIARLHMPTSMQTMSFDSTIGRTVSRNLPLKNAGNIQLNIEFNVTQAAKLFSVLPKNFRLSPNEERDVLVKYTPKQAPSVEESLLTMQISSDGPKYEVVLRGEAMEKAPLLLCNKQYISWGGVPVGRALQQKVVLRNSSDTQPLKLKVSVRGCEEFQLQSCFDSPAIRRGGNQITVNPSDDYPLNLLFAPTQVTTYQSTLIIKQSSSTTKYTVPLSGYGGVSKLTVEDVNTIGDMYTVNVGPVNAGQSIVCTLKIRNSGPRAAFVKAICFSDLRARVKLPSSRLSVEPQEFVLDSLKSRTVTVTRNISERDSVLKTDGSSLVGVIGFCNGDEILRRQYRKSLGNGQSTKMHLSSDNPLRGVSFQDAFLGEEHITEVYDLPLRPNDQQLFYSYMTRVMVALVSSPPGSNKSYSEGDLTLTDEVTPVVRKHGNSTSDHDNMALFTPPVRDNPRQAAISSASLPPSGAASVGTALSGGPIAIAGNTPLDDTATVDETWIVVPERLTIQAPSHSQYSSKSKPRVVVINNSNRVLSYEMSWPGHILAVTPQNGVIEPRSQIIVLVSAKHSIYSKGVELPWRGYLLIRCDGKQKDIRIQVRQDLAMDTSVNPTTDIPQALAYESVTPFITKPKTVSPTPVRVISKNIKFPRTRVETTSEATLEFQNTKAEEMKWSLSSFASAYVKKNGEVFRTTYTPFHFVRHTGSLGPGQKIKVILTFEPRDEGCYSQFWDLESSAVTHLDLVDPSVHGTRIELSGEAYLEPIPSGVKKSQPRRRQENSVRCKQRSSSKDKNKSASLEEISVIPKMKDAPDFQMNPISLKKDVLEFDRIEPGASQMLKLTVSNNGLHNQLVTFKAPEEPFSIKHSQHCFKARYFISLPVMFKPIKPGKYESTLVIQTKVGHCRVAKLIGECIATHKQDVKKACLPMRRASREGTDQDAV